MKQQDKLRNTLREHYDNKETPFDNNEWERASAYLIKARLKRKIQYSALILIILFSGLFIGLFDFQNPSKDDKQISLIPSNPTSESAQAIQSESDFKSNASKSKIDIKSKPNTSSNHSSYSKNSERKTQTNISKIQTNSFAEKAQPLFKSNTVVEPLLKSVLQKSVMVEENEMNSNSEVKTIPMETLTHQDNLEQKDQANETTDAFNEIENLTPTVEKPVPNLNLTEEKELQLQLIAELTPAKTIMKSADNEIVNLTPTVEKPVPNLNPTEEKEFQLQIIAELTPAETILKNADDSAKKIAITETLEFTAPEEKTNTPFIDSFVRSEISETDSTTSAFEDALFEPSPDTPLAGEGMFYEVGAAWHYGWKGPESRDARGFSPLAGINYMNRLNNNCSISFGLQYLQVRNLSNSSKTSRISTYEYGEQSSVTIVTPTTVHYLMAPLRYHYYLNKQNSFGAGINLAYLLNIDATVTSYDESPGLKNNYKTIKLSGYTEGFSWFDSQLAFFYRRKISPSFGLQAEAFLGLTDVKQNEFFGLNYKERNSGVKLSLIYFAFRKKDRP